MSKKNYTAPAIVFHELNLSTDISSDCVLQAKHAENMCPLILEDFPYSLINRDICQAYAPEITDTICYHVPLADSNVFSS